VNHTCFPKEDHLPDWVRRDNKITKGDRAEWGSGSICWTEQYLAQQIQLIPFSRGLSLSDNVKFL